MPQVRQERQCAMSDNMVDGIVASSEDIPGITPVIDTASIKGLETVIETPAQAQERKKRRPTKEFTLEESISELRRLEDEDTIPALRRCFERILKQTESFEATDAVARTYAYELKKENAELKSKLERIKSAASEI